MSTSINKATVSSSAKNLAVFLDAVLTQVVTSYASYTMPLPLRRYYTLGQPVVDCDQGGPHRFGPVGLSLDLSRSLITSLPATPVDPYDDGRRTTSRWQVDIETGPDRFGVLPLGVLVGDRPRRRVTTSRNPGTQGGI